MVPFATLVNSILKVLKDAGRSTRNCRIRDKHKLAIDLALVGFCIRTAYLVDAFTPSDHVSFWQELLQKLRSSPLTSVAFASIVHIFEPCSEQSFIVNMSMIPQLLSALSMGLALHPKRQEADQCKYPVFIRISQHPTFQLLDAVPLPLYRLLDSLDQTFSPTSSIANPNALPLTHVLPYLPPSLSVPFAAILLDFSVGYVPESGIASGPATAIPCAVSIHLFECILSYCGVEESDKAQLKSSRVLQDVDGDVKSCVVMKFSCPTSLQITHQPERIIPHLENLFTKRIISTGDPTLLKVEIRQTTHELDRLLL